MVLSLLILPISAENVEQDGPPGSEDSVLQSSPSTPVVTPELPVIKEVMGPGELVIEVDRTQSQNVGKSLPLAMLLSLALPGAGETYLGDKGHAKVFLLAEAGFWAGLYVAFIARDSYLQSARNYGSEFAGIDVSGKGEAFLNTMAYYRSYQEKQHRQDSYELSQILSGKRDRNYDISMTPQNNWDFGSSINPQNTNHWKAFQSTLRYYRSSKIAVSFAVGALALNRLVSLANTLHVFKKTSAHGVGLQINPEFGPDFAGSKVSLAF